MGTKTEDISSQVDGVATAFTIDGPLFAGSLIVILDGVRQSPVAVLDSGGIAGWFTEGVNSFTTQDAPKLGSRLAVQYETTSGDIVGFTSINASGIDPASC